MTTETNEHIQDVTLYLSKGDIPWYQRSWIWGCAALVIFLCGILCALLLRNDHYHGPPHGMVINTTEDMNNLLTLQQAKNQGLQEEITQSENILANGVCLSDTDSKPPANATSAGPGTSGKMSSKDLVALLESATVIVSTEKGHGTGFFVNPNTIITNSHVINGSQTIKIANKTLGRAIPVTLVNSTFSANVGGRDYAILQTSKNIQASVLTFNDEARKLAEVAVAGFPGLYYTFDPNVTNQASSGIPEMVMMQGEISVVHEFIPKIPVISHTASIFKGNSGGPLVNSCGHIVGINTFKINTTETGHQKDTSVMINFTLGSVDLLRYLVEQGVPHKQTSGSCGS